MLTNYYKYDFNTHKVSLLLNIKTARFSFKLTRAKETLLLEVSTTVYAIKWYPISIVNNKFYIDIVSYFKHYNFIHDLIRYLIINRLAIINTIEGYSRSLDRTYLSYKLQLTPLFIIQLF